MTLARVFQSGNSQAVRLPKEFRLDVNEVEIFRRGNEIVLRPTSRQASEIFDTLRKLPSDFMQDGREDTPPQERDSF
jgi:antitoxin VapB